MLVTRYEKNKDEWIVRRYMRDWLECKEVGESNMDVRSSYKELGSQI